MTCQVGSLSVNINGFRWMYKRYSVQGVHLITGPMHSMQTTDISSS